MKGLAVCMRATVLVLLSLPEGPCSSFAGTVPARGGETERLWTDSRRGWDQPRDPQQSTAGQSGSTGPTLTLGWSAEDQLGEGP